MTTKTLESQDDFTINHRLTEELVILPSNGEFYFSYQERLTGIPRSEKYLDGKEQYKDKVAFVERVLNHFDGVNKVAKVKLADGRHSFVDIKSLKKFNSSSKYDYKAESINTPKIGKQYTIPRLGLAYDMLHLKFKNLPKGRYGETEVSADTTNVKCTVIGAVNIIEIKNVLFIVEFTVNNKKYLTFIEENDLK